MFPLKQGDELYVDAPDAAPDSGIQFRFDVAFGEHGIVFGEPIVKTLASMLAAVESVMPTFEAHLA